MGIKFVFKVTLNPNLMKRIVTIFLASVICLATNAQRARTADKESFQFAKKIVINSAGGQNFRYEMAVRSENGETVPDIRFFGSAADRDDQLISDKFIDIEKRTEQEWTIFTIVGRMPTNTASIWFFTSVTARGTYYFDDISFFVEHRPGSWRQVDIYNSSFEEKAPGIAGFAIMNQKSGNPKTALSQKVFKTGRYSLMIRNEPEREPSKFISGE
jgi:hypothetical protein